MPRIGPEQLAALVRTYRSDSAIASVYGISKQAVQRLRAKYGIPASLPDTSTRDDAIAEMRRLGASVSRIARRYNLSETHIYRILGTRSGDHSPAIPTAAVPNTGTTDAASP